MLGLYSKREIGAGDGPPASAEATAGKLLTPSKVCVLPN
jgi:hypothetical protein